MKDQHHAPKEHGAPTLKAYIIGFGLSLALTMMAYFSVANEWSSGGLLVGFILTLAVIQLIVQLLFFLHLGQEDKPRWNLTTFWFALLVLVIIVFGSLWIMKNLDHNTMLSPEETDQNIIEDEGYKPINQD